MASKYASGAFWLDALDRAIATFAQSAVATMTATTGGLLDLDIVGILSVAGLAAAISVLTSVGFRGGSTPEVKSTE